MRQTIPTFSQALALYPLLILAAGCSPPADPSINPVNEVTAAPVPAPAATPAPPPPAQPEEPVADANAVPKPGTLKTFGDWTAGCDNGLRCTLGSLLPEMGGDTSMTISITREAGPDGAFTLGIESQGDQRRRSPASLAVDGKPVGEGLGDATLGSVAAAMAGGRSLAILDGRGRDLAAISLKGASAALRYIDAQQGRLGSIDGIVARGPRPSRAPIPVLPVIVARPPVGDAPQPTPAQLKTMRVRAKCDIAPSETNDLFNPETHALGGGATLVILPCSTGAYNLIGALFVVDARGVTAPETDAPAGFDETGADSQTPVRSVVNGGFENGVLTSYAKSRGLGDCGVHQSFVWDGKRFRLSEQAEMGECRGNIDYITTWRASVERR